jgi:hypothetical protein
MDRPRLSLGTLRSLLKVLMYRVFCDQSPCRMACAFLTVALNDCEFSAGQCVTNIAPPARSSFHYHDHSPATAHHDGRSTMYRNGYVQLRRSSHPGRVNLRELGRETVRFASQVLNKDI